MVRSRRAVRKPRKQKKEEYDSDDPNAYGDMEVPDKKSSAYIEDKVDQYHNAKISKLLAEGIEEESDAEEMDDEEEVMPIHTQDSEEDGDDGAEEEEEDMDSDLEGNKDDDLPDEMAWGNRRTTFYDTDYVGTKGKTREELEEEEQEEEGEAKNIQRRLAADLGEDDYDLNLLQEYVVEAEAMSDAKLAETEKRIGKDLVKMSQKEKLKLLKKESPELLELIQDFKAKLQELKDEIQPLVEMVKDGRIPAGKGANYLLTKQQLYLHYCSNISFYLVLKAKRIPAHNHPIIERLLSYRNLINDLGSVDARLAPQLRLLLSGAERPAGTKPVSEPPKAKIEVEALASAESSESELDEEAALQFYRGLEERLKRKRQPATPSAEEGAEEDDVENAKRGIIYQMSKNKGLTPKRKKIDRNPRVKHREKFRKAQIRRKGQVQQVHREMTRYSGELSGIRAGVKKSIKLK